MSRDSAVFLYAVHRYVETKVAGPDLVSLSFVEGVSHLVQLVGQFSHMLVRVQSLETVCDKSAIG